MYRELFFFLKFDQYIISEVGVSIKISKEVSGDFLAEFPSKPTLNYDVLDDKHTMIAYGSK